MRIVATVMAAFVALQHVAFMILEMFLWTKPIGLKVFKQTQEKAEITKVLAANQGLYNGFLAAGLVWALLCSDQKHSQHTRIFFLACVLVAGLFGAATASRTILFVQALPALLALILTVISAPKDFEIPATQSEAPA